MKGVPSALQHVSKTSKDKIMEDRGFDDCIRTSGSAPIAAGYYSKSDFRKKWSSESKKERKSKISWRC